MRLMEAINKRSVKFEQTPNPQTFKFSWGEKISDQTFDFKNSDDAMTSPLASKIFGFPWAQSVFIGIDFIAIEKQDWVEWTVLAQPLAHLIEEHIERGEPIVMLAQPHSETEESSEIITKIKWVLEHEIRPAVAMDGGDVQFVSFQNGYLKIAMQGACSGCPSSQITLKEGIETHLKNLFPEVISVSAL